jgi:hypothetical protein
MIPVSPEQIGVVARTWDLAGRQPERLHAAVAERLPGPGASARAGWVVDAVGRLSSALARPTALPPAAAAVIASRGPVTLAELAVDRDACLDALRSLTAGFGPTEEEAWEAAFQLFQELVGPLCLDPFGTRQQRSTP